MPAGSVSVQVAEIVGMRTPLPVAFLHPGPAARYMLSPQDGNHSHGGNGPMTVPMERVENRILSIRASPLTGTDPFVLS